jgi:chaperone protein EcpD
MVNQGQQPLLVQSWLDDGHEDVDPQTLNVPFIASPQSVGSILNRD